MSPFRPFAIGAAAIALFSAAYLTGRHAVYAQSQYQMNMDAYKEFQKSDKELNVVYRQLIKKYSTDDTGDAATRKKIVASERAWIRYRDAEADAEASVDVEGGSMYPMEYSTDAAILTDDRIKKLKVLMKGSQVGGPNP